MSVFTHEISVVVALDPIRLTDTIKLPIGRARGVRIPGWKSYSVTVDMLTPADAFDLEVQFTREAWDLLRPDAEIGVYIDETRILTGYVGTREKTSGGSGTLIRITGRDKTGRLVDESAPLFRYGGLGIRELAEKICGIGTTNALFKRVVLVNARNRLLMRGRRVVTAPVNREPTSGATEDDYRQLDGVIVEAIPSTVANPQPARRIRKRAVIDPGIFQGRATKKKVNPGQTRWSVLEEFLREARLLAWSTGDGEELFIGLPNYDQEAQYEFRESASESAERDVSNCRITVTENVEEMYSEYVAVGASRGSSASYGANVIRNRDSVYDNPENTVDGTGINFRRPKRLLITDDGIKNKRDALERAEREQLEREASHFEVLVEASGHSQEYRGTLAPVIYVPDTMAKVRDGDTGLNGDYLITSCTYTRSRESGTRTSLRLVPRGTLLVL